MICSILMVISFLDLLLLHPLTKSHKPMILPFLKDLDCHDLQDNIRDAQDENPLSDDPVRVRSLPFHGTSSL